MLDILQNIDISILDIVKIVYIVKYIFKVKCTLNKTKLLFSAIFSILSYLIFIYFRLDGFLESIQIIFTLYIVLIIIGYSKAKFLLILGLLIILKDTDKIILSVLEIIISPKYVTISGNQIIFHLLIYNLLTCIFIGIIKVISNYLPKYSSVINFKNSILLFIMVSMNTTLQYVMMHLLSHLHNQQLDNELILALSTLGVISIGEVIVLMVFAISKDTYKKSNELAEYQLSIKTKYYEDMLAKEIQTRKFRHDVKNLLLSIQLYNQKHDYNMIDNCVNELLEKPLFLTNQFHCGDDLVNAILSDKNMVAAQTHATIECTGHITVHRINKIDICTIFGNLLDNAIEACKKLNKKSEIQVQLRTYNQDLFIRIENPIDTKQEIRKDNLITTKENKEYHGFGLKNVKECIDKYQGIMDITIEDNKFITFISLKNVLNS